MSNKRLILCLISASLLFGCALAGGSGFTKCSQEEIHNDASITAVLDFGTKYLCEKASAKYGITCKDVDITQVVSVSKQELKSKTNFDCSILATNNDGATLKGTFTIEYKEKTGEKIVRKWQYNVDYKTNNNNDQPSNPQNEGLTNSILEFGAKYICEKASAKYGITCKDVDITQIVSVSQQKLKAKTNFQCSIVATNNDGATLKGTFTVEYKEKTGEKIVRKWQYHVNYNNNDTSDDCEDDVEVPQPEPQPEPQPQPEEEECVDTEVDVEVDVEEPQPEAEEEECITTPVQPEEEECINPEVDVEVEVPQPEAEEEECITPEEPKPEEEECIETEVDVEVEVPETETEEDCTNTEVDVEVEVETPQPETEEDCTNTEVDVEVEVPQPEAEEEECITPEEPKPEEEECIETEVDVEVEVETPQPETEEDCTNTEVDVEVEVPQPEAEEEECITPEEPKPEEEKCVETEVDVEVEVPETETEEDCTNTEVDVEVEVPQPEAEEEECITPEEPQPEQEEEDCTNTEVDVEVEVPEIEQEEECVNTEVEVEVPEVEEDCTTEVDVEVDVEVPQPETEEDCTNTEVDVEVTLPETEEEECTTDDSQQGDALTNEILKFGAEYVFQKAAAKYGVSAENIQVTQINSVSKEQTGDCTNYVCDIKAINGSGATVQAQLTVEYNNKTQGKIVRKWKYSIKW